MRRSNEELALLIQSGQKEHVLRLWEQVQDFIKYLADKHLLNYPPECRQLHGDMVNQAYFHFLKAIEGYREDKGKFANYLTYHVKNAFNEVLQGRTSRTKNEPLNSAVSLDTPIEGAEDLTLADMLIDTQSEGYYRQIEDEDLWRSVRDLLQDGIDELPDTYRDMFQVMLERGVNAGEALRLLGVGQADKGKYYGRRHEGLRKLKSYVKIRLSREKGKNVALEECISYYTGVGAWRNRRFTSVVEQAVMRRNDDRMTARAMEGVFSLRP